MNIQRENILRLPQVKEKIGLSRSTIYLKMSRGEFPAQILLGTRSVGWLEDEISQWITQRIEAARGTHRE